MDIRNSIRHKIGLQDITYKAKRELLEWLLNHGEYVESTYDNTMSGGEIYWGLPKEDFEALLKQFGLEEK